MTVQLEWGVAGAQRYGDQALVRVVVDVLSFTTCVSVAADRGLTVLPYQWAEASAATYARARGALLAVARSEAGPGQVSLSPGSLRAASADVQRVVLPSPNGSAICEALGRAGPAAVVAACLRNRRAVASYLAGVLAHRPDGADGAGADGADVLVVPAGERWPDASLRPALEDWWGAGSVVSALADVVGDTLTLSEEAAAAAASYRAVADRLPEALLGVASGQELAARGFADDVVVAAELDRSDVVPVLAHGAFVPA